MRKCAVKPNDDSNCEISAHKAANPEAYPIDEDVKSMLPSLQGVEERYAPTKVHLQVYDGELNSPLSS